MQNYFVWDFVHLGSLGGFTSALCLSTQFCDIRVVIRCDRSVIWASTCEEIHIRWENRHHHKYPVRDDKLHSTCSSRCEFAMEIVAVACSTCKEITVRPYQDCQISMKSYISVASRANSRAPSPLFSCAAGSVLLKCVQLDYPRGGKHHIRNASMQISQWKSGPWWHTFHTNHWEIVAVMRVIHLIYIRHRN